MALACFKCSDSGEWRKIERRGKKAKERNWEREGFLPLLSLPPTLFFVPSPLSGVLESRAFLALTDSAKKEPQENHECLKVTYDQAFFFFRIAKHIPSHWSQSKRAKIAIH